MADLNATVLAGVLVFVADQLLGRFVFDPLQEFRRLRGEVAYALLYLGNVTVGPGLRPDEAERGRDAAQRYRDLASQLWQRAYAIPQPLYPVLAFARIVPTWAGVRRASGGLIGLIRHPGDHRGIGVARG